MKVGESAPTFTALDSLKERLRQRDSKSTSLQDFQDRWLVLYFYPKDDTPGCTTEAIDFTTNLAQFAALNAVIVGISPDSIAAHSKFINKHNLQIILLSDPEHQIAESYGVWQLKKFMGKEYMGIIRSTFLIDPQGAIRQIWSNVRVKNHVETVLEQLKTFST